jgi:hypothetical protein
MKKGLQIDVINSQALYSHTISSAISIDTTLGLLNNMLIYAMFFFVHAFFMLSSTSLFERHSGFFLLVSPLFGFLSHSILLVVNNNVLIPNSKLARCLPLLSYFNLFFSNFLILSREQLSSY